MIKDKLFNASNYYTLSPNIEKALKYIQQNNLKNMENGKYEIDGNFIFIGIQEYKTKPLTEGKLEAHKQYIDIQYIIKGKEKLGYTNISDTTESTNYDEEKDIIFLDGNCDFLNASEGDFLIFFPQDAHMPSIAIKNPEYVKKAVVKIRV